jgi:hypothetical protein
MHGIKSMKISGKCYRAYVSFRDACRYGCTRRRTVHTTARLHSNDCGLHNGVHRNTLLTLGTCHSLTISCKRKHPLRHCRHHPGAIFFDVSNSVSVRYKGQLYDTRNSSLPTQCADTEKWRRPNCSCGKTTIKKLA